MTPRSKKVVFALITMSGTFAMILAGLLAVDLYLHRRAERSAGLNVWGYRGPLVGAKKPGEMRVVMIGGSTVFGYGVRWHEAVPALLEQELMRRLPRGLTRSVSVVNLGMNSEGAYSFPFTLRDFEFLDYDVVVLYEGYNDVAGANRSLIRHGSPVFRLFGYYPILPLFLDEKRLILKYGDLNTAYRAQAGEKVVFTPTPPNQTAATALDIAQRVSESVARQLDHMAGPAEVGRQRLSSGECPSHWMLYCDSIAQSIEYTLEHGRRIAIVTQPYFNDDHRRQQDALRAMLQSNFERRDGVFYVDLGDLIDLSRSTLAFDRMHLNREGNATVARALAPAVMQALAR